MAFLNAYGYDYQYTESAKIRDIARRPRPSRLFRNFKLLLSRNRLDRQKAMRAAMKAAVD